MPPSTQLQLMYATKTLRSLRPCDTRGAVFPQTDNLVWNQSRHLLHSTLCCHFKVRPPRYSPQLLPTTSPTIISGISLQKFGTSSKTVFHSLLAIAAVKHSLSRQVRIAWTVYGGSDPLGLSESPGVDVNCTTCQLRRPCGPHCAVTRGK
jgi:hypothetical protein